MFDEKDMDRTDALGQCFREIGGEMLPPTDLVKAAKAGVRLHRRVDTATHVRRFAGAVALYAACVALLLGTIFLLPRLFDTSRPANTGAPTTPLLTEPAPSVTTAHPDLTQPLPPTTEHKHEFTSEPCDCIICTEGCTTLFVCKSCGYYYTESIPAPGHDFQNGICSRCGAEEWGELPYLMMDAGCPKELLPKIQRPLNESELSSVESFLADEKALQILCAATFARPEDIRLYGILYGQIGSEAPYEEKAAVAAQYGDESWLADDCTKMTTAQLDALLRKYVGIPMDPSLQGDYVFYLSEYDSYYIFATDGYGVSTDNLRGWLTVDGSFLIRMDGPYEDRTALLVPTDDGYLIRQMIQLKGSP